MERDFVDHSDDVHDAAARPVDLINGKHRARGNLSALFGQRARGGRELRRLCGSVRVQLYGRRELFEGLRGLLHPGRPADVRVGAAAGGRSIAESQGDRAGRLFQTQHDVAQLSDGCVRIVLQLPKRSGIVGHDRLGEIAPRQRAEHPGDFIQSGVAHFHEAIELQYHLPEVVLVLVRCATGLEVAACRGFDETRDLGTDGFQAALDAVDGGRNRRLLPPQPRHVHGQVPRCVSLDDFDHLFGHVDVRLGQLIGRTRHLSVDARKCRSVDPMADVAGCVLGREGLLRSGE